MAYILWVTAGGPPLLDPDTPNVTLPCAVALASKGWRQACTDDASLALGVNTHGGHLVNAAVGEATGLDTIPLQDVLTGH